MSSEEISKGLQAIAAFLPRFEALGFVFGTWGGGDKRPDGAITMPYFELSGTALEFVRAANTHGFVLKDFDWPTWSQTKEARRLRDEPAEMLEATSQQLRQLLTVIIRAERFSEGSMSEHYESGLLGRILQRAAVLGG